MRFKMGVRMGKTRTHNCHNRTTNTCIVAYTFFLILSKIQPSRLGGIETALPLELLILAYIHIYKYTHTNYWRKMALSVSNIILETYITYNTNCQVGGFIQYHGAHAAVFAYINLQMTY